MIVLGIETSCDETAAAVVEDGTTVRSAVVHSQSVHAEYGGVVPELASRDHLRKIGAVAAAALRQAGTGLCAIDAVAATSRPGLAGALLVGCCFARGLALGAGKPWVAVNHVEAHLHAAFLEDPTLRPPLVALIASGGHTSLFHMDGQGGMSLMGRTLDDAAGEAFDKVAQLLGLGYPGGRAIEQRAQRSAVRPVAFPRPLLGDDSLDFSFSGLKTAVLNHVRRAGAGGGGRMEEGGIDAVCAGFQDAVCEVLAEKLRRALEYAGCARAVLAGGVAANGRLRLAAGRAARQCGATLTVPRPALCTDNAAMVAACGSRRLAEHGPSPFDEPVSPRATWPRYRGT
ncbi:MAG: tRNA (adenosine(37)-N6)-threonylcarbamoyltransferase complex transferase subunit TsaD [Candidatus Edwardsbacteria bacterium]|jgi:N6-L-threonylcarbamoyladenine synthase|nr:tRNA (adenosine(37)-N6)-threonylcarbamoyltransferase complex transferase subunit TsaD [Candidatus Edwardsbacteria bacterium]